MNFGEFWQQRYGAEIDALFEQMRARSDYQLCVQECRRAYNDCMFHHDQDCSPDLQACFRDCADGTGKALIEELKAVEARAIAAYKKEFGS